MRRKRFTERQIIEILKQHEAGVRTVDLCREHGISSATIYNWKARYSVVEGSDTQRLKQMEDENRRLKQLVADLSLDREALRAVIRKSGSNSSD
jgi:putative transposase